VKATHRKELRKDAKYFNFCLTGNPFGARPILRIILEDLGHTVTDKCLNSTDYVVSGLPHSAELSNASHKAVREAKKKNIEVLQPELLPPLLNLSV
jgi:hypothetical protein